MARVAARRTTARQAQLFDQLVALFLDEGFAHFTLDDIAARLRCSKSTLYALAENKDRLVYAVTVHFFRGATERVEADVAEVAGAETRIRAYLESVGRQLEPASARFMDDIAATPVAREVYERNTRLAADRVRVLISEGVAAGELRDVHAAFAADVVATVMVRIQQRQVAERTGLADAQAYRELAALLTHGLTP
ncbi:TetR/AcrR family transcriptional regulator [Rhodococcus artemisiae]|uniref:TetR/AcrR family transcriptional regulator n=1 Tax=Rhodococcus artemisiae TaxID=714159 RepID=A0ABU7LKI7_9NOCA|nr:TetR/AcrR family transcriptional regulator [Rhodococcus artemisiae]MEE2062087.1 TetR/AcrR family transcriptional regulator [Rhodococcus artemisiae]